MHSNKESDAHECIVADDGKQMSPAIMQTQDISLNTTQNLINVSTTSTQATIQNDIVQISFTTIASRGCSSSSDSYSTQHLTTKIDLLNPPEADATSNLVVASNIRIF